MRIRGIPALIGCGFLMVLLQFYAAEFSVPWALGVAVAVGVGSFLLFRFFRIEVETLWAPVALAAIASFIGILPRFVASTPPWFLGLGPVLAFVAGLVVMLIRQRNAKRCALCNRRVGSGTLFECPRCGMLVCDAECWAFGLLRCRLCEQNKVPILKPDARWWDKQFGPRVTYGRCQICQTLAAEADLRACRRCGRPHCRDCWDFANGECSHCRWVIDDLPPQLTIYMASAAGT
ncbi:MAG: hypothetical protein ACRD18_09740 [Terriglobia bacterium]